MQVEADDIRRAFDENEFFPVFQPQVELRTGQLTGFEALARWQHKELGAISPEYFVPRVEAGGLINQLTRTMLDKAFASASLVNSPVHLSVNFSPIQLLDIELPMVLAACAERRHFSLERLTVEVTESALLGDLSRAKAVAQELKALRCSLALDDFGTGYSSLKHLQTLPFDQLKVDRSFVGSMTESRESRKIVAAVVGLGQSLGMTTVAEGVETVAQANMLLWMGCDLGQGWFYGRPAPVEEVPRMLSVAPKTRASMLPAPRDGDSIMSADSPPSQRLAQLQAIYDGAPVGLCFLDRNMRYVSLNRRLAEMNGAPATAHLGKTVAEVIPRLFPLVERFIRRALQGEPVTGVEIQKPPSPEDGETPTVLLSYQPARDEAGEVVGVSVAVMDVTEHKRAEEALRESEVHYQHMVQLNPHVPWVLDATGAVIEGSPRWETLTGQPVEQALGDGWTRMLHTDDVEPTRAAIRNSLETGEPIDLQYRVRSPDGAWKWMRSRGSPRFGPSGEVVCIYGVVEEVHAQKQIGEELQNCQAELRAVLEAVPAGVILADAEEGRVVLMNRTAKTLLGDAFVPGQKLSEHSWQGPVDVRGRSLPPNENPLARAILTGEATDPQELLYQRPQGGVARLEVSGAPIYGEDCQLIGAVMIVREMKPAE